MSWIEKFRKCQVIYDKVIILVNIFRFSYWSLHWVIGVWAVSFIWRNKLESFSAKYQIMSDIVK